MAKKSAAASGDVIDQGEPLTIAPPPSFIFWEQGQSGPTKTPGTLRVEVSLDVNASFPDLRGLAIDQIKRDVLAPAKLKSLLAYIAKACPTVPKMTGAATGQVAATPTGVLIVVRIPVLFTQQPDAGMTACVEAALKKSNDEVRKRLKTLVLKAER